MVQEKSEQIFFAQPKAHQNKFADLNKMVPANPLRMIAFFKQCQATNKATGVLEKIAKDKKQPKEKSTAHVPTTRSCESSYKQHRCHKYCNYHQSDQRDWDNRRPDHRHQDDQRHDCGWRDDKDARNTKSYNKKDDCKCNHFKKKATRPCTMTSPLCWAPAIHLEEGVDLVPDLFCALALVLALAQAAGATKTIMSNNMIASWAQTPNAGVHIPRTMMADITTVQTRAIAFLPPSLLQRQREVIAPRNRESRQQSMNSYNVWIHLKSMNSYNVWIHMKIMTSYNVRIHMMTWIHLNNIWVHITTWIHLIIWIHMSHYGSLFQIRNSIVWLKVTLN